MTNHVAPEHWAFLPNIVQVKTIAEGLHFIGLRIATGGSPSLRCDPQTETAACIALLNAFQHDQPHAITHRDVYALRLSAHVLEVVAKHSPSTLRIDYHATALRIVATKLEAYVRPAAPALRVHGFQAAT